MRASKRKNEVILTPGTVPESKKTVSPAKDERFWCPNDTLSPSSPVLSQINPPVATTPTKSGRFLGKSQKFPYLCIVKTSIKRVKSRMQFELFRAKEVKSEAQSEQTLSVRQYKKVSITI